MSLGKKTTEQLGSFIEKMKMNPFFSFDQLQREVTHLGNKYRKELGYLHNFQNKITISQPVKRSLAP